MSRTTLRTSTDSTSRAAAPARANAAPGASHIASSDVFLRLSDEVAVARELIALEPMDAQAALFAALQQKVAYHSQRDNESTSDGATQDNMCNLTTLAMCLEYLGFANPGELDGQAYPQFEDHLEALPVKKGYASRTSGSAIEALARDMGATQYEWVIANPGNFAEAQWRSWNDAYVARGSAMLLSIGGHIVRWQGVVDAGLVIDDPYGVIHLEASSDADSNHWSYDSDDRNTQGTTDDKGEDNVWAWADVAAHAMKWMVAIT